jgi:hypothetical protein
MPPVSQRRTGKKYFTVAEANATLPLVRRIVADIVELDRSLRGRLHRLIELRGEGDEPVPLDRQDEADDLEATLERGQEQMESYERELAQLGVELKDPRMGLIDFPCWHDDREICLCWRHGEGELGYWHETDAGFAGRRRLGGRSGPR